MDQEISSFLQYLVVEKGFSNNTSQAYRNDLSQFWDFLQDRQNGNGNGQYNWAGVSLDTLNDYIVDLRGAKGYRDTTTARKVAAIRSFFGFLFRIIRGTVRFFSSFIGRRFFRRGLISWGLNHRGFRRRRRRGDGHCCSCICLR